MNTPCRAWEDALARSLSDGLSEKERGDLDSHLDGCGRCRKYLEDLKADDEILTELADEAKACGARIEAGVIQALREEAPPRSRTAFPPAFFTPRRLAGFTTAAAAILLIVCLVLFTGDKSVYADVFKALKKIRTMRSITKHTRADGSVETVLILYARGHGVYRKHIYGDKFDIVIDNGRYEWQYHSGNTVAVKRPSSHPRAKKIPSGVEAILTLEVFRKVFEKPPVENETVDGIPCRVYRGRDTVGGEPIHYGVWIDESDRFRKYEETVEIDGGEMRVEELWRLYYDERIDPDKFKPDFGPGVKILEGDEAFREQFNPARAIFTQEHFGLDFAVHELKRCEDGKIYMVASLQPTTQTIADIGPVPVSKKGMFHEYGAFQFESSWKRFKKGSIRSYYTFQTLAEIRHDGLAVTWVMWYPVGDWPEMDQGLLYAAYIFSRNELKEKFEAAGEKWFGRFTFPPLPLPEEKIADREAYRLIFDQVGGLEQFANLPRLILGHEPSDEPAPKAMEGVKVVMFRTITSLPSRISFEDCETAWRKALESEKKANLDLKAGRQP